jgi:hypothetical protein
MAEVKFEVYDAAQNSCELVAGGKNISVTWENKQKFCEALLRYRLTEFEVQCEAIRRGLATVVPVQLLSLYTWQELEARIAGATVDVDLLEQATEYKGVNANDPHVKLFWQMMRERFTDEQRSRFISFVWGRSRLPTSLGMLLLNIFYCPLLFLVTHPSIHLLLCFVFPQVDLVRIDSRSHHMVVRWVHVMLIGCYQSHIHVSSPLNYHVIII